MFGSGSFQCHPLGMIPASQRRWFYGWKAHVYPCRIMNSHQILCPSMSYGGNLLNHDFHGFFRYEPSIWGTSMETPHVILRPGRQVAPCVRETCIQFARTTAVERGNRGLNRHQGPVGCGKLHPALWVWPSGTTSCCWFIIYTLLIIIYIYTHRWLDVDIYIYIYDIWHMIWYIAVYPA